MLVKEVMHRDVLSVHESDMLRGALVAMLQRGVRHAPVVRDGQVVGILSERNVLAHRARHGRDGMVVEAMTEEPYVVDPETSLETASAIMSTHKIGCLPVVDVGHLVGIISTTDLATALAQDPVPTSVARPARAQDVMQAEVQVIHPDDTLLDAGRRLLQVGIRHLPVVDGDRRLIGMFSDRDLRSVLGDPRRLLDRGKLQKHLEATRVSQIMTRDPSCVARDAPLDDISTLLVNQRVGALPVVDDDMKVVGIISYIDMLRRIMPPA
jgi:CBS domain-containing protein